MLTKFLNSIELNAALLSCLRLSIKPDPDPVTQAHRARLGGSSRLKPLALLAWPWPDNKLSYHAHSGGPPPLSHR